MNPHHEPLTFTVADSDEIILELKMPVPVRELAVVTEALCKMHGRLFIRQTGMILQIYKP